MARLLVDAVATNYGDPEGHPDLLTISASIADAQLGTTVTGLPASSFSASGVAGAFLSITIEKVYEFPPNSGFYNIQLRKSHGGTSPLPKGIHVLGLKVQRTVQGTTDFGQTITSIRIV